MRYYPNKKPTFIIVKCVRVIKEYQEADYCPKCGKIVPYEEKEFEWHPEVAIVHKVCGSKCEKKVLKDEIKKEVIKETRCKVLKYYVEQRTAISPSLNGEGYYKDIFVTKTIVELPNKKTCCLELDTEKKWVTRVIDRFREVDEATFGKQDPWIDTLEYELIY